MNTGQCENAIREVIKQELQTKGKDGIVIPALIKKAWGTDAQTCHFKLGTSTGIEKIINEIGATMPTSSSSAASSDKTHGAAEDYYENTEETGATNSSTSSQSSYTSSTQSQDDIFAGIGDKITDYAKTTGWIIFCIFFIMIFFSLIKYVIAFVYDVFNATRMIYVKVIVPRGDSKSDREKEKELAKDMKEKIGRMAQVYRNIHKLGELSVVDNIMRIIFYKPKLSLILHYEEGTLTYIIGTYPEYKNIIEGAIAAQYAEASIETIKRPLFFSKKYSDIIPLQPVKDTVYPIRTFKQLEDDPMNNVIDSVGKLSAEDTFSIVLTIKPEGNDFNKKAQKFAEGLYKKDEAITNKKPLWKKILMPWSIFDFILHGPSQGLIKKFAPGAQQGDPFIRMVKAEEEALNTMGEEAGKHAFQSGLLIMTSTNEKSRLKENMHNVLSSFTVYKDEYNNELDQPEIAADLFGWLLKPVWKFSALFHLPNFFYFKNIFTVNELTSLYHLPDGMFNRSPIIKRLDYKVIAAPDNLPVLKEDSGFVITGQIAEGYKGGSISEIFKGVRHWAVGEKEEEVEELVPLENIKDKKEEELTIVEKNGKKFAKIIKKVKKAGLKVFKDGTLLGVNVHRNKFTPVYISKKDRSRHHYIIGKSGGGKSVYIASMARQDIWNGEGICVIDPHGDLVEDILEYIPKERAKDVIYFDAGNEDRPMGLNLYEIDNIDQADRVVNDATEIFLKMFGAEIFGPRIQEYFKYGSLTLLEDMEDGATLLDVPRLFTDEVFREYKVKKVKNPIVRNFWERTYNSMGDREKQEIIPYFTSKFVSFNTNRLIRNIIGQTKSAFRFRQAMDEGKILLVNLSKGKIGEINAQLLGMILVSQIYNAAMSRANVPEEQRRDFFLYVDEFQNFVTGTFADILSEARKYHLSLIMAHQYIAQLESGNKQEGGKASVKDAVFGNVGSMQSFKVGAPDAEFLEKEYAPVLSGQDIIGISNYKVYIKENINNATSRVFSMDTIWTKDYQSKKVAEILKEYSGKKYGRKREFVDAEICARLGMMDDNENPEGLDEAATQPTQQESNTQEDTN